jgi:hypothetical protein
MFSTRIKPFIEKELLDAKTCQKNNDAHRGFYHLERAHVLGQESTYWHVKVHVLMLIWGIRNRVPKEVVGQVMRILGAATKTAVGLVPKGNTGGANVSPFQNMPIPKELELLIVKAKARTVDTHFLQ